MIEFETGRVAISVWNDQETKRCTPIFFSRSLLRLSLSASYLQYRMCVEECRLYLPKFCSHRRVVHNS